MKLLRNMKMSTKLIGSFTIIIIAMIAVGVISISSMTTMDNNSSELYDNNFKSTSYVLQLQGTISLINLYVNMIVNHENVADYDYNLATINEIGARVAVLIGDYEALIGEDAKSRATFTEFNGHVATYRTARAAVLEAVASGDYDGANAIFKNNLMPAYYNVRDIMDVMVAYEEAGAEAMDKTAYDAFTSSRTMMIIIIAIISVVAMGLGLIISNLITKTLKDTCDVTQLVAKGDLTASIPEHYRAQKEEFGNLTRNVQAMRDSLYSTVDHIKDSCTVLDTSVTDTTNTINIMNDRITDTSAATEQLSAGMEETGASAEEMNATAAEIERAVETVAEKAGDGATKSGEIHQRASDLGKSVNNSIDKSNQIFNEIKIALEKALEDSKAVDEINALADAILGITSQTTLLALNASIEAARAGEAGRGFAVVANEISALADNSKNTVTQIQAITKVVMSAVSALASSSTNLLNFVSDDVMKDYQDMLKAADSYNSDAIYMSDMTGDLSATSQELLASIQILMRAISEVSSAAQEGARTTSVVAEQTNEISMEAQTIVANMQGTDAISKELNDYVKQFKL